jgi:hypothetical protein
MSMVHRLLDQLKQRGLRIAPGTEAGQLLLCGPDAEKTPEVIDAVKKFKPQLLKLYAPEPQVAAAPEAGPASQEEPSAEDAEGERCTLCSATVFDPTPDLILFCRMRRCPSRRAS